MNVGLPEVIVSAIFRGIPKEIAGEMISLELLETILKNWGTIYLETEK